MSAALLLARAARLLGWPPDRWARGWPDLLTAAEIATLEACDETGKPDPGKRGEILALLQNFPPPADGQRPAPVPQSRVRARQSSYIQGGGFGSPEWLAELGPTMAPGHPSPAPVVAAFRAQTYRQWPPRDWPPGPMVAAWLEWFETLAAMPQGGQKPEPEPAQRSHTEARAMELAAVLDGIEARAEECGLPLVRSKWPGTKAEFRKFLEWHNSGLYYTLPTDDDRLSDELRPHGVTFGKPGRARDKGLKIYRALFPDYPA